MAVGRGGSSVYSPEHYSLRKGQGMWARSPALARAQVRLGLRRSPREGRGHQGRAHLAVTAARGEGGARAQSPGQARGRQPLMQRRPEVGEDSGAHPSAEGKGGEKDFPRELLFRWK